jgi:hypothetical protein
MQGAECRREREQCALRRCCVGSQQQMVQSARRSQILQDDDACVLVSRQQAWRQPGVLGNLRKNWRAASSLWKRQAGPKPE